MSSAVFLDFRRCQWKERNGCKSEAADWSEDGEPNLCLRHRTVQYKREEDKRQLVTGRKEFNTLKHGDIVRLYWSEPRIKYYFAEVVSVDRTLASAVLVETVVSPQPESGTPGYDLVAYEPSNTSRGTRKLNLTSRGTVKLKTVSPAQLYDHKAGEKPLRNLTGHWGLWDYAPIAHRVMLDTPN